MHRKPYLAVAVCLLISILVPAVAPSAAGAQLLPGGDECTPPMGEGPTESTPASGGSGIMLDAAVTVRYTSDALFDDPASMLLVRESESGVIVPGRVQRIGDVLVFTGDDLFRPFTAYDAFAVGIDFDLSFSFTTGGTTDMAPPSLAFGPDNTCPDGAEQIESTYTEGDACGGVEPGYRVDLRFPPATDDGAPADIEYLVYVTRGAQIDAPVLKKRERNYAGHCITTAFTITREEAVSPMCVVVHAVDGVGKTDTSGTPVCFDPIQGNFFAPLCSIAGGAPATGAGGTPAFAAAGVVATALALRAKRRRARARRV